MGTSRSRFGSARLRGLALVALVALPLIVVTTYTYARERDSARQSAQAHALNIAILAQHEYQLRIDAAQQMLTPGVPFTGAETIAQITADPAQCNEMLAAVAKRTGGYLNLFELSLSGDQICSSSGSTGVNAGDRDYFQQALRTLKPAVGAPQIGRVANKPTVAVGYPILDARGAPLAVAAASLDLSTIVALSPALEMPAGSSVTLVGTNGTVLARNLDPEHSVGNPGPGVVGLPNASFNGTNRTATGTGVDGVSRLYGIVALRAIPDGPIQGTLLVGIPTRAAYGPADAAFRWNVFWLVTFCIVATIVAWFGSERLFARPLRSIAASTQRIARGDFVTPTGLAGAGGEIGMLATAIDNMAAQLETSQVELKQDRLEMASILSTATAVIVIARPDGTMIRVNPAIERLFGWPAEESIGRDLNTLIDERVLPRPEGERGIRTTEHVGRRPDGSAFPVEVEVREVDGTLTERYIVVFRDISNRARLEAEREFGKIAAARAEFLRTLSHELRSPLTAVLGFAQLLRDEPLSSRAERQAQDIEEAGRHMLSLVNDLLDLERIDAGHWDVNITEVQVGDTLEVVAAGLRHQAIQRELDLSVYTAPSAAVVATDARILREVATNLVENAIKYTERGGVIVRAEVEDNSLLLEVRDTGVGIPADRLESIFSEFEQLRPVGTQAGTGLGLAITRRLVNLVGGTIHVDSVVDAGSVFVVRIPITIPVTPKGVETASVLEAGASEARG